MGQLKKTLSKSRTVGEFLLLSRDHSRHFISGISCEAGHNVEAVVESWIERKTKCCAFICNKRRS